MAAASRGLEQTASYLGVGTCEAAGDPGQPSLLAPTVVPSLPTAMLAAEKEPRAIRKLGQLFRLSEVHLWDDSYVTGANEIHKPWHAPETGFPGSQTVKTRSKPAKQTDEEDHSFVEDLELISIMGALGLPVSFCTSQGKKNTPKKGKRRGRQALYEAANTPMNDDVRTCANAEEIENVAELMACVEHTNSCNSSWTAADCNGAYRDDIDKMLGEDSAYVEESGCGTICSDKIVPGYEAENQCELEACQFHDNMSNPVKSDSPVRENQAGDSVMQLNKEMLGKIFVDNECRISCAELCQEGRLTREDQISGEAPLISYDENDINREVFLTPAEPSPVDNHVQKTSGDLYYVYGDWKVIWDKFYSQYYFCNILTQESTWYPPQGLEGFASCFSTYTCKGLDKPDSQYTSISVQEHSQSTTKFDQSSGVLCCANSKMDDCISESDQHVVQYGAHLSARDNGKETFDQAGDDRHLDEQQQDLYSLCNLSDIPDEEPINESEITTMFEAQHAENIQDYNLTTEALGMNQEIASTKKKKESKEISIV